MYMSAAWPRGKVRGSLLKQSVEKRGSLLKQNCDRSWVTAATLVAEVKNWKSATSPLVTFVAPSIF